MSERPGARFYDEAETMNDIVWTTCGYLRGKQYGWGDAKAECKHCPAFEYHRNYGSCKIGCRALAEELVARVLEAKAIKETVLPEIKP